MKKKLLTLDDLINFCQEQKFTSFNSQDSGYQLCVHVPATFSVEEDSNESMMYASVILMHTNRNRNQSDLTEDAAKKCLSSIPYKPLLAEIKDFDGELDFTNHAMEIDDEGNINYIERQIGCFTADKAWLDEEADEKGRKYIHARVAIPKEYTAAADIIERKNGTKISAELAVNSMEYSIRDKVLRLTDVEVLGATCLGRDPDDGSQVGEGMEGARLDIEDFSVENNSVQFAQDSNLVNKLDKLIDTLSDIANQKFTKGGSNEVTTDSKVEEFTEEVVEDTEKVELEAEPETDVESEGEVETESEAENVSDTEETVDEETEGETIEDTSDTVEYSVTRNGKTKNFSVSMNEIISGLMDLCNEVYSEADNDYYFVTVYEDTKEVVMSGVWSGANFRQQYKKSKNNGYSLVGERVPVYVRYVTEQEDKALDDLRNNFEKMKSEYEEAKETLNKYESEPEKLEILASEEYSSVSDTEEFKALSEQSAHFDLSIDEVKSKADAILLNAAKSGTLNFAQKEDKPNVGYKYFGITKKKNSRYGGLLK